MKKLINLLTASALVTLSSIAFAQTDVPNTFEANTPAAASEVNANFDALATAIDALASRVTALENASPGDGQDTVTGNVENRFYQAFDVSREVFVGDGGGFIADAIFSNDISITFTSTTVEVFTSSVEAELISSSFTDPDNGPTARPLSFNFFGEGSESLMGTYVQTGQSVVITIVEGDETDIIELIFSPDGTNFIGLFSAGSASDIEAGLIVGVEVQPTDMQ